MIAVIGGSGLCIDWITLGVEVTSLSSERRSHTAIKCQEILDLFKRSHSIVFCSAKAPAKVMVTFIRISSWLKIS